MARRPGDGALPLSPNARRAAGWLAAIGLVVGIAVAVRIVGGSGDGLTPGSSGGPSPGSGSVADIAFGTALDPATGLVAAATETATFGANDTFAYSVDGLDPPASVSVEVERVGGGDVETVQPATPQQLGPDAVAVAFEVPAAALVAGFGSGVYRMRIYVADDLVAEGEFTLVAAERSAAPSG
jgi:hypothetical protein